ncbi:helix-turn-helix domain-containing protein (plasmid) [Prescottella equi]|uniref:Excisionase family DNA-binding protein n=1 Tax=Rhodococcus hoagii TaxID=43767 RepID=A0A9Q2UQW8_RHOHA|nr:helix-turn-helix domain-containing protein [Prescottella equi]MBM4481119.1 excisionase family DNA-binding protein [Prescottella equi]MBM4487800.1 excisionase family DNA-binding protein [Prescottella equi]MBM4487817.1 excisionase family DNA-binding protein [Prescottella equi]MBM4490618.1 excisionase family DNA-binding protein [Prescottella equi]MBM4490621.1 excisionase family DNA-binding protein [Prescottella equi]
MSATLIRDDKTVLSLTSDEVEQARAFKARVDEANTATLEASNEVFVGLRSGETVEMPAELSSLVRQVLDIVSRGGTVTVGSVPNEVTTTTAAKMLGISRPTLMKLVKDNQLAAHKVGSHTRLFSKDVFAYKDLQRANQRKAFDDLRALEDKLGIVD